MATLCRLCCIVLVQLIISSNADATPEFARTYNMACIKCHVHVPKLNSFGEQFAASGYKLSNAEKIKTLPFAAWVSAQSQNRASDATRFKTVPNRVEFISAGATSSNLSYFIEWRALSRELLPDGTVRDRSGRFEDLFVLSNLSQAVQLQVGQFRPLAMIDVSRRLNLSEPTVFSSALAGETAADPRISGLRGFSPSGRSPAVKVSAQRDSWSASITVPFPGEFSIPITQEAKTTASFEFEYKPKGVFLEVINRQPSGSWGFFAFTGDNRRSLLGVAAQHKAGNVWIEGGIARGAASGTGDWRYSLGLDWVPVEAIAAGVRIDHRQIASETAILSPYVSLLRPFKDQAAKLVFEGRFQKARSPRFAIELSWMF
jgi:hypothetical protein